MADAGAVERNVAVHQEALRRAAIRNDGDPYAIPEAPSSVTGAGTSSTAVTTPRNPIGQAMDEGAGGPPPEQYIKQREKNNEENTDGIVSAARAGAQLGREVAHIGESDADTGGTVSWGRSGATETHPGGYGDQPIPAGAEAASGIYPEGGGTAPLPAPLGRGPMEPDRDRSAGSWSAADIFANTAIGSADSRNFQPITTVPGRRQR